VQCGRAYLKALARGTIFNLFVPTSCPTGTFAVFVCILGNTKTPHLRAFVK